MIFESTTIHQSDSLKITATNLIFATIILAIIVAASSSLGTGMYAAGFMNTTATGVKNTIDSSVSVGSNFVGYGDIDVASNNDVNVLGSMLASVNSDVSLSAVDDINIEDGVNTANNVNNAANIKLSFAQSVVSNTTSTLVQSGINGDSNSDILKDLALNITAGTIANAGAKGIGGMAHAPKLDSNGNIMRDNLGNVIYEIDKPTQLALHAGLGAGVAAISGNDALSGAVSGVVGELTGEYLRDSGVNKNTGSQLAGLAGGYSAIFAGSASGLDDSEIADNIFSGQRIGNNAALNNAYFAKRPLQGTPWLGPLSHNKLDDISNTEIAHEQLFFEDELGGNIGYSKEGLFEDSEENLQKYKTIQKGFDDDLMREAVENVNPQPYSLLGFGSCQKYNCQDWAEEVRGEYYKLLNQRNLDNWNLIINNNFNHK